MRALIVSCVFPPEPVMSAQTSHQIAEHLVQRGHEVTVIAPFPSRPAGTPYDGHSRALFRRSMDPKGFKVMRCPSFYSRESRMTSRFAENLSFGLTGAWAAMMEQRPDIIYANTWPIVATCMLATVARWRRVPLVVSVQDVYPESLEVQGRIPRQGMVARWMRRIDTGVARRCHALITISPRFADIYRRDRRVDPARVHVIPNWTEPHESVAHEQTDRFRAELGIPPDAFVVAYGGNVGVAAGVETVVQAFQQLDELPHLRLVIAGACVAMINPSLYEGWSTSVEEAKSMGKTILLSNIAVHREQAPVRGLFFDPRNVEELAEKLWKTWTGYSAEAETQWVTSARSDATQRLRSYAVAYQDIICQTLDRG